MRAVDQWRSIEADLPAGWEEARLSFVVEQSAQAAAAAGVLGPLGPGRVGDEVRFVVHSSGSGGPQALTNLLGRMDGKRLWGTLTLRDATAPAAPVPEPEPEPADVRPSQVSTGANPEGLVSQWDALVETLPPDWSDLLCRLEADSTDYLATAALLGAPLNPSRIPGEPALRFRVSSRKGYGASPLMVRRCFERMDEQGVTGELEVVTELADTQNVATQGPVWRVAGRSV
ncbi:MAG TPA: hypothetical protein VFK76_04465 [Gaiellaceae bacterium]|nr:hypothetical protein [Gaiellaceae bacterium]